MSHRRRSPKQTFGLFSLVLIVIIGYFVFTSTYGRLDLYPAWLLTLSVVTFIWYGFDKGQSKRGGLRVPEIVLQLLTLAGGFPGGWLGRAMFHHKTRHDEFRTVLILSTLLHAGLLIVWLTGLVR